MSCQHAVVVVGRVACSFALGTIAAPDAGMEALPAQLAARLRTRGPPPTTR